MLMNFPRMADHCGFMQNIRLTRHMNYHPALQKCWTKRNKQDYSIRLLMNNFARMLRQQREHCCSASSPQKMKEKPLWATGHLPKGNTLLNYCGIRKDFLDYTVDANPHKQNLFLPGTHIPIKHPDQIRIDKPDYILILPWNIKEEIMDQLSFVHTWGGKFIIPIPCVEVIDA